MTTMKSVNLGDMVGPGIYWKNLGLFSILAIISSVVLIGIYGSDLNEFSTALSGVSVGIFGLFFLTWMISWVDVDEAPLIRDNAYTFIKFSLFLSLASFYMSHHSLIYDMAKIKGVEFEVFLLAPSILVLSFVSAWFFSGLAYLFSFVVKKFTNVSDYRNGAEIAIVFICVALAFYCAGVDVSDLKLQKECFDVTDIPELQKLCFL